MRSAALFFVFLALAPPAHTAAEETLSPSELEERVEVHLVETILRATDGRGNPLSGLRADEIEVFEGGEPRRVAQLEPFLTHGTDIAETSPIAVLYDARGEPIEPSRTVVLSPRPARRIALAFDVANSKIRVRDEWRTAALEWVTSSMKAEDRVGIVVLENRPEWVQRMTNNPSTVRAALERLELGKRAPQRDRRSETTRLYDEMLRCAEAAEAGAAGPARGSAAGAPRGTVFGAGDDVDCALSVAEPWAAQWHTESAASIAALRTLTGELAAIPGHKEVLLFSEGIIPDAGGLVVDTMLAIFGVNRLDQSAARSQLKREVLGELSQLHEVSRAAGVSFFTFDTRSGADRGHHDVLEAERPMSSQALGINPWVETYQATSTTLSVLAAETGGEAYYGGKDLGRKVAQAAASYFGMYNLAYYRPENVAEAGKLRVRALRRGVELTYSSKLFRPTSPPRRAALELSIRNPEPTMLGDRQSLPIVIDLALADLPFRKVDGTLGCPLAYFVQAAAPDGTVVAEAFEQTVVAFESSRERAAQGPEASYRQLVRLELPPGAYRVRARVNDDLLTTLAERSIDLTVVPGGVRGGLD